MHIDWFVFFSQIVNLLILVYLLKRFLYGRIISAMDAREAKIASTFEEAEKSRAEAREAAEKYEKTLKDLESRYEEMMNKAREEVETHRREMLEKVREEIDQMQTRWFETLRSERQSFLYELRRLAGTQIYAIARHVLKDLADFDLEEKIVDVVVERLENMAEEERQEFREAVANGGKIIVQSAFEVPRGARDKLDQAIRRCIAKEMLIDYEKSADVTSGFELKMDGHKVAWSMKEYLDTLEESFYRALYEKEEQRT
jgi:F-type H+-transporting ATPase subunit b